MQTNSIKVSIYEFEGYTASSAINLDGNHKRICLSFPPVYNSCNIGRIIQTISADYIRQIKLNLP